MDIESSKKIIADSQKEMNEIYARFEKAIIDNLGKMDTVEVEPFLNQFGSFMGMIDTFGIKMRNKDGNPVGYETIVFHLRTDGIYVFNFTLRNGMTYEIYLRYAEYRNHIKSVCYAY